MIINSNFNNSRNANFGQLANRQVEKSFPPFLYLVVTSDDQNTKPSAENYKAYLRIQEVQDVPAVSENELESNLTLAKEALKFVKDMHLRSNTAMEHENPYISYRPTGEYEEIVSDINYLNNIRQRKSIDDYVKITKERAPLMGVGNCSDQAILAANYLIEKKNYKNVAMIALTMKGQNPLDPGAIDQHVFAVMGLDKDADLTKPETWGENAVVVDPWGNICDPINSSNPSKSAMNKLYVLFRTKYLIFDNYSKYIDRDKDKNTPYNWENYRNRLVSEETDF